jgi:predicted amidohydrolase
VPLRIAGLQTAGTCGDVAANLAELAAAAAQARSCGAELLITPEMFVTGYDVGDRLPELARADVLGPTQEIAAREGIAILLGGPDVQPEGIYNTAFFVDQSGRLVHAHHKSHLFGELDRGMFAEGTAPFGLVDHAGVRIAIMICYEVEFPELVRAAALAGAHLIAVPTAQMEPFSFIAEQVVRTRAWENQVYVAYVDHDGAEGSLTYVGRSSIVAPDATVLDAVEHGDRLIYADIDPCTVTAAQAANPYLTDRRPLLYAAP